jgi:hypothetical protein
MLKWHVVSLYFTVVQGLRNDQQLLEETRHGVGADW